MTVTALLVSHDGARWLPAVLAGLQSQQHPPQRVLAVDTGSADESTDLLVAALGLEQVRQVRGGFASAVQHVLAELDTEWVWLLHDDANPAPEALAALLRAAEETGADVVGPKLREWPSLRRLLEVGVTITGAGRRETGLERGEYDQGQHDQVRRVLAVNTAGMLVRRSVLAALGGFDEELPVIGADLDFGWRASRAGHRVVVAPEAVVFHVEASRNRQRDPSFRPHLAEREAALFLALANVPGRALPWRWIRLLVSGLLRALGLLLARAPRAAADEIGALAAVHGRPARLRRARAARRTLGETPEGLLAPWWLPARHGLDYVSDVASAAISQGRDVADRRREDASDGRRGSVLDADDEDLADDSGWLVRLVTSPVALGAVVVLLLFWWGAREAFGEVAGGALAPAPPAASDWWRLLTEGWHPLAQGTDAPAPSYLLPLAVLGSLLTGSATAAVSALLLLAVPLGAWGAWRFAGRLTRLATGREASSWVRAWAALANAVVPLASGAWGQGRLGVVVSTALLPWLAGASLGLLSASADRRWRAGWRTGLLLAVVTAFTPGAWLVALLLMVAAVLGCALLAPRALARPSGWGPVAASMVVTPILLLPGAIGLAQHDLAGLLIEAGLPMRAPDGWDLITGRLPGPAAPVWLGPALVLAALLALVPGRTRLMVSLCWVVAALSGAWALLVSRVRVELPSGEVGVSLAFPLVLGQLALVAACLLALHALGLGDRRQRGSGLQRVIAGAMLVVVAVIPVGGFAWWLVGDTLLGEPTRSDIPAYLADAAAEDPDNGVLEVRGSIEEGLTWQVYRGHGVRIGEPEILALTAPDPELNRTVADLFTDPSDAVVAALPSYGVTHVVLPAPGDPSAIEVLDSASGLTRASTSDRAVSAWEVVDGDPAGALDGDGPAWLPWLIAFQTVALVVVLVLCGPSKRESR
ncbi:glycosyltransferase [Nocardioides daejeonensis]|uniref:glycosyltransferase n=1 Tax=Nocardioides daejeonensis TaxID=1046556 RepID=UPI0013A568EB|nr:glycosyltransferase [Nocardioides daejeonensis]